MAQQQRESLRASTRNNGSRFDLDARCWLDKTYDLDERHARVVDADDVTIGFAEHLEIGNVFVHVDDIPGQAHEMFGSSTALRQDRHDVFESLPHLRDKPVRKSTGSVPTDDTTGHDEASFGHDAVRIALRLRPTAGLKHPQTTGRGGQCELFLFHCAGTLCNQRGFSSSRATISF